MSIKLLLKHKDILIIILFLAIVVFILQFTLLELALKIGFKPDDWILYLGYKTLGADPLSKVVQVWGERGIYTTYQVYYLGILESIVGFDYRSFQITSLLLKLLATLAVFPVVFILFKDKILAMLTTIFYAVSPSSIGPLEFVVKGSDYAAIFWMCLFFIVYYLTIKSNSKNFLWLGVSFALLILTLIFSPIRLYPILILIPVVETLLLINNRKLGYFKKMIIRILVFYLPFMALVLYSPNSVLGYMLSPIGIFDAVKKGSWHLVLSPLSGMGDTFITSANWGKIFGSIQTENLQEYIYFLLGGPTVIFGMLTLIIALSKAKKPLTFFLAVFSLNFILEILFYFVATNKGEVPYDPTRLYSALFGIYILVLGLMTSLEWIGRRSDNLLMAVWTGSLFLFNFVFATWILAPFGTNFSSTSYYLVVASIGTSLLEAAFFISLYYKIKQMSNLLLRSILLFSVFILIILIFGQNSQEIRLRFLDLLANGRSADGQKVIQGRFREHIKNIDFSKPALFYFDATDIPGEGPYYSEGFLIAFPHWMHFQDNKLIDGCIEIFYGNRQELSQLVKTVNGEKGFYYRGLCVDKGKSSYRELIYKPENFYAFKLKSRDFIDIREKVLNELRL